MHKRSTDPQYKAWIGELICLVCHKPEPDPHHVNPKGKGGKGTKADDRRCIPLCRRHHNEYHNAGRDTFAEKYGMDYEDIISRLNKIYEEMGHDL